MTARNRSGVGIMPSISRDHVPFIFERLLQIERLMTKVCFKIDWLWKFKEVWYIKKLLLEIYYRLIKSYIYSKPFLLSKWIDIEKNYISFKRGKMFHNITTSKDLPSFKSFHTMYICSQSSNVRADQQVTCTLP